jgi:MFS family permease
MIYYLGFSAQTMGIMQGLVMLIAVFSTIPAIQMIKKDKSSLLILISVLINAAGLIVFGFFITPDNVNTSTILNPLVLVGILLISVGYLVFFQTITVWSKRLFPEGARGQFEGLRIIFYSLIPMIIAPLISNPLIKRSGEYINEYGIKEYLPTNTLFIAGLFIVVFTLIPLWFADAEHRKNRSNAAE